MPEISASKRRTGRGAAMVVIAGAVILALVVLWMTNVDQRTDDANIIANYIGIAPEVEGRIISLPIRDNQNVNKGQLLYEIDPLPYQYKVQQAISERDNLEQQIIDERRKIGAQTMAVKIANRGTQQRGEEVSSQQAAADAVEAEMVSQQAVVASAEAQSKLATRNLERAEPLLTQHYITLQQVDELRTSARSARDDLNRQENTLAQMRSRYDQAKAQMRQSVSAREEQALRERQSLLEIDRLETLLSMKLAKEAAVRAASYDLERCHVYSPFDARVTNLTISVGQYAHTGTQVFALIDTTAWWAQGNFKETQLHHIAPGMPADVYLMTRPDIHFQGVVESIGYGVTPEDVTTGQAGSLPTVTRTLNWVRLAQRFPVRVRVLNPAPALYRLGATATVVVRSLQPTMAIPENPNVANKAVYPENGQQSNRQ